MSGNNNGFTAPSRTSSGASGGVRPASAIRPRVASLADPTPLPAPSHPNPRQYRASPTPYTARSLVPHAPGSVSSFNSSPIQIPLPSNKQAHTVSPVQVFDPTPTARWVMEQQAVMIQPNQPVERHRSPSIDQSTSLQLHQVGLPYQVSAPTIVFQQPMPGMFVPVSYITQTTALAPQPANRIPQRITSMQVKSVKELLDEGAALYSKNLHDDAVAKWEQAVQAASVEGDWVGEAKALANIACSMRLRGRISEALNAIQEAWAIARAIVQEATQEEANEIEQGHSTVSPWTQLIVDAIPSVTDSSHRSAAHLSIKRGEKSSQSRGRAGSTRTPSDGSSGKRPNATVKRDPGRGPPLAVFMMDLTNNLGNIHYSAGNLLEAKHWHRTCLRLVDSTLELFPISQRPMRLKEESSGIFMKKLSYVHKCALQARVRALTHLALCEPAPMKPSDPKDHSPTIPSLHKPVSECYPYKEVASSDAASTHSRSKSPASVNSTDKVIGSALLPNPPTHRSALNLAADISLVRIFDGTLRRGSSLAKQTSFELFSGLQATAIVNGAMVWASTGLGLDVALEQLNNSMSLFKVSSNDSRDDISLRRVQAWLGCLCVEIGRTLDGMSYAAKRLYNPKSAVGINDSPGIAWIERGTQLMQLQLETLKSSRDWMGVVAVLTNLANAYNLLRRPYMALHFLSLTLDPVDPYLLEESSRTSSQMPLPVLLVPHVKIALWQALCSLVSSGKRPWYPPPPHVELPAPPSPDQVNTLITSLTGGNSVDVTNLTREQLEHLKPMLFPTATQRSRKPSGPSHDDAMINDSFVNTMLYGHMGILAVDERVFRERMIRTCLLSAMASSFAAPSGAEDGVGPMQFDVTAHPSFNLYDFVNSGSTSPPQYSPPPSSSKSPENRFSSSAPGYAADRIRKMVRDTNARAVWNPALMCLAADVALDVATSADHSNVDDFAAAVVTLRKTALETWGVRLGVCRDCCQRVALARKVFYEDPAKRAKKKAELREEKAKARANSQGEPPAGSPETETSEAADGEDDEDDLKEGEGCFPCRHWRPEHVVV
ncbi:hypothetical protein DFJ73DRAFT_834700 [Zopfochytrium polystomum]|nr:hypothetical protein DFJ73DRAFT_834700 [Zopfochytrium polystomum]